MSTATTTNLPTTTTPSSGAHTVVISGYYGFDNLGDELILQTLIQQLRQIKDQQFDIHVLSNNPVRTAVRYDVKAVDRTSFVDIIDILTQAHLFVSGGGGLFQDVTGPASPVYYGGLIILAQYFQVPIFFWSQGVGPLKSIISRQMTKLALSKCDKITVRDNASARLIERLTGTMPEITADPVWLLDMDTYPARNKHEGFWTIGLSLRPWKDLTENRIASLAKFFTGLAATSEKPVRFMLFPFQEQGDFPVLQQFKEAINAAGLTNVCFWVSQDVLVNSLGECDVFFGMRYHSLLLSLLAGVPIYGLVYDPKVEQLIDQFKLGGTSIARFDYLDVDVVSVYLKHYQQPDLSEMKARSAINIERLVSLINADSASKKILLDD